jgi:hypothetical protein
MKGELVMTKIATFTFLIGVSLAASVSAQVSTAWAQRYDGLAHDVDVATAVALDAAGGVYVTGQSCTATDPEYGGCITSDITTVKYDPDGDQLWLASYHGPGNGLDHTHSDAIAIDATGNVYVTGASWGGSSEYDYVTLKYDSGGNQLWVRRYNGPGNDRDIPFALALDPAGNVYVTGGSVGAGTDYDYATIKYGPDGNELWVSRYNGPANGPDGANALVLDSAGNVYVTGNSFGIGTGYDYATVKYDPNGNFVWVARYDGPASDIDVATAVTLDANVNVYVTGQSCTEVDPDYGQCITSDIATIKYDPNGLQLWIATYHGPGNGLDHTHTDAMAVDSGGNLYVTGASWGLGTEYDYVTIKYDTDGSQLWANRYDGPGNDRDIPLAIALDVAGNTYVTGGSLRRGTSYDYATVKYDTDGNQIWVTRYNGPANGADGANAVAIDPAGNVYVTGNSEGVGIGYDYATIKYAQE